MTFTGKDRLNILWLLPALPLPPDNGFKIRVLNLLEPMSAWANITLFVIDTPERLEAYANQISRYGRYIRCLERNHEGSDNASATTGPARPQGPARQIERLVEEDDFDVIILEHLKAASYLPCNFKGVTVLSTHNVETLKHLSFLPLTKGIRSKLWAIRELARYFTLEARIARRVDLCITVSKRDQKCFHMLKWPAKTRVAEVPIGMPIPELGGKQADTNVNNVLAFSGAMGYVSNIDAVMMFCQEVLPRVHRQIPDTKFLVIGRDPPEAIRALASEHVIVTGRVPDVTEYLLKSAVFVSPLRTGGGAKVKILQAMALGLPVVTLPEGARGIDAVDGRDILVANDPEEFSDRIVELLKDRELRLKIGQSGRQLVLSKYDRDAVARDYYRLLQEMCLGRN